MKQRIMAAIYVLWGMFISLCFLPVLWKSPPSLFMTLYIPVVIVTFILSIFVLAEAYVSGRDVKRISSGPVSPDEPEAAENADEALSD